MHEPGRCCSLGHRHNSQAALRISLWWRGVRGGGGPHQEENMSRRPRRSSTYEASGLSDGNDLPFHSAGTAPIAIAWKTSSSCAFITCTAGTHVSSAASLRLGTLSSRHCLRRSACYCSHVALGLYPAAQHLADTYTAPSCLCLGRLRRGPYKSFCVGEHALTNTGGVRLNTKDSPTAEKPWCLHRQLPPLRRSSLQHPDGKPLCMVPGRAKQAHLNGVPIFI